MSPRKSQATSGRLGGELRRAGMDTAQERLGVCSLILTERGDAVRRQGRMI